MPNGNEEYYVPWRYCIQSKRLSSILIINYSPCLEVEYQLSSRTSTVVVPTSNLQSDCGRLYFNHSRLRVFVTQREYYLTSSRTIASSMLRIKISCIHALTTSPTRLAVVTCTSPICRTDTARGTHHASAVGLDFAIVQQNALFPWTSLLFTLFPWLVIHLS